IWDDMPYSDALKGIESTNPTYDTQESIYNTVFTLLNDAKSLLGGAPGSVVPGSDDVFFGGDIAAWSRVADALIARARMKQGDLNGAMSAARESFASAEENLIYQYPDANAAGGWFRFNRDREGDIEFHPTLGGILSGLNDTLRLNLFNPTFLTNHPYMVADFPQEMVTYREMQFIIAESDFRMNGGTQDGYDAYIHGIKASFARCGFTEEQADAYIAQPEIGKGVGNLTLEDIMIQKYIGMYLQPEAYNDWRRTGIPSLVPVSGNAVPVRWHYASDEYLFNSNSPSEAEVNIFTDKVGWNR
ncbi:MAG: SusD/RagB family nutrient-binding outer membrane lipoprotein, partial [Bacteroidota bacterium]